ncbi:LPXTG-motif cell wall anchor domain protein [Gardnerella vaginalis ATCC 14019]|uniref:LPXTG-motif cell wall anchor domain protein n=1 Tax=Gardnerella vaginalis (strain ATCC 14019 / 317) TaxID=525284 RepID=E3D937_GARV3|nr:hypothetical protein [Gardnerella vaginalis]ADP38581.1 LPXTG-motif cell wall anchor domain protein [Gardnerella vaginalis ATCC 14019]
MCRDANEPAKGSGNKSQVWSENLNKLFFKLNSGDSQKVWGHANFRQQETCRKNGNKGDGCVTDVANPMLFDSTRGTMERSRGFISNTKAPTETGKYYCAVFALKPDALTEYKNAVKKGTISVVNNSDIVSAMSFKGESGIDYAAKFFPVYVVKPFKLPKTGGMNWNMLLGGVVFVGTSLMLIALLLDQSKWGLRSSLRLSILSKFLSAKPLENGALKGGDADENFLQRKNCSVNVPCVGNGIA